MVARKSPTISVHLRAHPLILPAQRPRPGKAELVASVTDQCPMETHQSRPSNCGGTAAAPCSCGQGSARCSGDRGRRVFCPGGLRSSRALTTNTGFSFSAPSPDHGHHPALSAGKSALLRALSPPAPGPGLPRTPPLVSVAPAPVFQALPGP